MNLARCRLTDPQDVVLRLTDKQAPNARLGDIHLVGGGLPEARWQLDTNSAGQVPTNGPLHVTVEFLDRTGSPLNLHIHNHLGAEVELRTPDGKVLDKVKAKPTADEHQLRATLKVPPQGGVLNVHGQATVKTSDGAVFTSGNEQSVIATKAVKLVAKPQRLEQTTKVGGFSAVLKVQVDGSNQSVPGITAEILDGPKGLRLVEASSKDGQVGLHFEASAVRGTEISLAADNADERYTLAFDGQGHLATVTVVVDMPGDGQVTLHLESPNQSLAMPAASLYSHFRLREGTALDFRPVHVAADAKPTYRVAPTHAVTWRFAIQATGSTQGVPFKGADAILKNERTGDEIKLPLSNDPQFIGRFVSPPTKLPVGKFDAIVSIITTTGAAFRIKLPQHVESLLRPEAVSLEIPFSADATIEGASFHPARIDFGGELGDAVTKRYIDVILRSREVDYPLDVMPEVDLADSAGHVVPKEWIKFSRPEFTLQPGQAEKLRITLTLPATYEESVEDGPFTGLLNLVRKDSRQPLQVVPFEKVSGGKDDEPVNRVVFVLSRPQPVLHSIWAMHEWLKTGKDGSAELSVQVAIGQPFKRTVTVDVTNTSTVSRTFKLLPGGRISDADGRTVPGIELLPTRDSEAARELAPGETGRWTFQFRTDSTVVVKSAEAVLHLTAPGLRPQLIMLPVRLRSPMLGPHVKTAALWGAALFGLLAVVNLRRLTVHKAASTGRVLLASVKKPIAGMFSVVTTNNGAVQLVAEQKCQVRMPGESRSRTVHPQQHIPVLATVTRQQPIQVEFPGEENTPPRVIEVTDVAVGPESDAQIQVVIASGGESDHEAIRSSRKAFRNSTLAGLCLALALTITAPAVVTATQWVFDLFFRLR